MAKKTCIDCGKRPAVSRKGYRCHTCYSRLEKRRNPVAYFFNALRNNARRRGHEFKLTLQEFRDFCEKSGYMEKKGRRMHEFSIDRIDRLKGYCSDNIQILSMEENIRKYNEEERCPF